MDYVVRNVEGKIQIEFHLDDDRTATMTMPEDGAQALLLALAHALGKLREREGADPLLQTPMLDMLSPTFQLGSDEHGRPMLALQVDPMPPFRFRFCDHEAKQIADVFNEILATPMDVRRAKLN